MLSGGNDSIHNSPFTTHHSQFPDAKGGPSDPPRNWLGYPARRRPRSPGCAGTSEPHASAQRQLVVQRSRRTGLTSPAHDDYSCGGPGREQTLSRNRLSRRTSFGGVAEWTKAPVLKTGLPKGNGGSNPSSSASFYSFPIMRNGRARRQRRHFLGRFAIGL